MWRCKCLSANVWLAAQHDVRRYGGSALGYGTQGQRRLVFPHSPKGGAVKGSKGKRLPS